jgi:DNA replication protein DnaC
MEQIGMRTAEDVKELLLRLRVLPSGMGSFKLPMTVDEAEAYIRGAFEAQVELRGGAVQYDEMTTKNLRLVAETLAGDSHKFGLLLAGTCGNGKTTTMRAVQSIVQLLNNTYYNRCGERIGNRLLEAKEIAQLSGKPEQLTAYQTIPLLFLDDLGREPTEVMQYGNVTSPITELLEYRYNQRLTTIVTTNLEPSEVRQKYGDRIADRFNEMFAVVSYTGASYRR